MQPNAIEFFAHYIEKETGIVFSSNNLYQLKSRLDDIVKSENLTSMDDLANRFLSGPNALLKQRLLDHATNNETLFFRDPNFFRAIENFILTEVLLDAPREIKIWSAASSTGQEALSVAMSLDALSNRVSLPPFRIVATDISRKALTRAKVGIYSDFELTRGLDSERRDRYFRKHADGWQVRSDILSKVQYSYNNLIHSSVTETFHLILCRNVLIYQNMETKKNVVGRLFRQLEPNGGLLLGVGETLLGVRDRVTTSMIGNVIFYRNNSDRLSAVV